MNRIYSQKHLLAPGLCLSLLAIILLFILETTHSITYTLILILFAVTALPFISAVVRNRFDLFEIIYPVAFLYFLFFGIRTIYLLNNQEKAISFFFVPEATNRALLYTIAGFSALFLGYYSRFSEKITKHLPKINFNPDNRRTIQVIIILYVIGMLSRGFFFLIGRRLTGPSVYNLIDYVFIFCQWSFILAVIFYFSKIRKHIGAFFFLWFIFLPVEVFFTFLRPGKAYFLPIFFGPFMAYHYLRKKIHPSCLIIPILIMLLFVAPIIPTIRSIAWQGLSPKLGTFLSDVGYIYTEVSKSLSTLTPSEHLQAIYHEFMNRIHGIDSLTTVIRYTPEAIDFQYGRTLFATFGFLIPQFIRENTFLKFLDIEILSLGRRLGSIYYGIPDDIAGIAITQIGELYLNFHIFGVLIGMFLLGIFYKTFYLYFIRKNSHPFSLFIYIILWFWIVIPEYWFVHTYENFLKQLILLLMVCWYLNGGRLFGGQSCQK
jgi:hypothetical protein